MTGCLPSLLRPSLGLGDARSCLDLAVRQAIDKLGLSLLLLAEVNRQLDVRGLIVKRGTSLTRRLSPAQSGALPRAAASIRAIPTARFTRKRQAREG